MAICFLQFVAFFLWSMNFDRICMFGISTTKINCKNFFVKNANKQIPSIPKAIWIRKLYRNLCSNNGRWLLDGLGGFYGNKTNNVLSTLERERVLIWKCFIFLLYPWNFIVMTFRNKITTFFTHPHAVREQIVHIWTAILIVCWCFDGFVTLSWVDFIEKFSWRFFMINFCNFLFFIKIYHNFIKFSI